MTARVYTGADFAARSLRGLTIETTRTSPPAPDSALPAAPAGAARASASCDAFSEPHPAARRGRPAARSAPEPVGEGSREDLNLNPLPFPDIRVAQIARARTARHAEAMAVLADRAFDPALKASLAALAETHALTAQLFGRLADDALADKQKMDARS